MHKKRTTTDNNIHFSHFNQFQTIDKGICEIEMDGHSVKALLHRSLQFLSSYAIDLLVNDKLQRGMKIFPQQK